MDTQNYNEYNTYESQTVQEPVKQTNGLAIASLIVSIIGLLFCCCYGVPAIICGIAGLILGIMANKKGKSGMATAGIIISIVSLVFGVLYVVLMIVGIMGAGGLEEALNAYM